MSDKQTNQYGDLTPSQLYDSIGQAETGNEQDPYIRTRHRPEGGSTAFGPVQITYSMMKDYKDRGMLDKQDSDYFNTIMEPMYLNFKAYGNEPNKQGYQQEYDYGGSGFFPDEAKEGYERAAKNMLMRTYVDQGRDINSTITRWRGVSDDKRYNTEVLDTLNNMMGNSRVKAMQGAQ